jgi:hypothetical protein
VRAVTAWPPSPPSPAKADTVTWPTIRSRVGNENNPADPWGRSELVIHPDGSARLEHHFSRGRGPRAWSGRVDAAALDELLAALEQAGFPPFGPAGPFPPDTTLRWLAVEADGVVRQGLINRDPAPQLGYAVAFDLIDAVIRQLSGDAVDYPTKRGTVVHGVVAVQP